jgi:hypothetical protein
MTAPPMSSMYGSKVNTAVTKKMTAQGMSMNLYSFVFIM